MDQAKEKEITEAFMELVKEICDKNDNALKELVNRWYQLQDGILYLSSPVLESSVGLYAHLLFSKYGISGPISRNEINGDYS